MKKIVLCLSLSFVLALGIYLFQQVRMDGKVPVSTRGLAMVLGGDYEMYLDDGGEPFEFHTPKEFTSKLKAAGTGKQSYLRVLPEFVDGDGLVIDTWGRPFQITRKKGPQIEIRSAGYDGKFDTSDDIVLVSPSE